MKFFVAALVVAIIVVGVSADDENPWDGVCCLLLFPFSQMPF